MLLGRFHMKCHRTREVIGIHTSGEGVVHVFQRLVELAPRERNGLDLDMPFSFDAASNNCKFAGAILACGIVQEQVVLMPLDVKPGTQAPRAFREHACQLLGGRDGTDAKASA